VEQKSSTIRAHDEPVSSSADATATSKLRHDCPRRAIEYVMASVPGSSVGSVSTTVGARCQDRARKWVHGYAAGGAAYAIVPIPIPGSTTAGLVALEATMVHAIGRIYGEEMSARDAAALVAGLEVTGGALKTLSREAVGWIPGVGLVVRAAIAAAAIEAIGNGVIVMFEKRHPGRRCNV
jgi:uncharacterized protein (DUF697 family)